MFEKGDLAYHSKRVYEWITYQYSNITHLRAAISTVGQGADDGGGRLRCPCVSNVCTGGAWINSRLLHPGSLRKM